mgnify:CR=1 FL=1
MKYRLTAAALLILCAAFFQTTILGYIELFGVRTNVLMVLTVIAALLRTPIESAIMGCIFGLVMDVLLGKTLGWYALLFMLTAILIALVNEKLYREKLLVLLSFSFLATVLIETLFFLIVFLFRGYSDLPYFFSQVILIEAALNGILILPLFKPVMRLYNRLDTIDRKRNRLGT